MLCDVDDDLNEVGSTWSLCGLQRQFVGDFISLDC